MLAPNFALAHRMNTALSVLEVNDSATHVEVSHKLYAHDLEDVFGLNTASLDYFESDFGMKQLDNYLRLNFVITSNGSPIDIKFVGTQVDFDVVYALYEFETKADNIYQIDSNVLFDFNRDQTNFVNIHYKGNVQSYSFKRGDGSVTFSLEKVSW